MPHTKIHEAVANICRYLHLQHFRSGIQILLDLGTFWHTLTMTGRSVASSHQPLLGALHVHPSAVPSFAPSSKCCRASTLSCFALKFVKKNCRTQKPSGKGTPLVHYPMAVTSSTTQTCRSERICQYSSVVARNSQHNRR